jgi:hypothetical protein
MSKLVVAILISPCFSMASVNSAANTTEVMACPNTVKIETVAVPKQLLYARYQHNAFRFMKALF